VEVVFQKEDASSSNRSNNLPQPKSPTLHTHLAVTKRFCGFYIKGLPTPQPSESLKIIPNLYEGEWVGNDNEETPSLEQRPDQSKIFRKIKILHTTKKLSFRCQVNSGYVSRTSATLPLGMYSVTKNGTP